MSRGQHARCIQADRADMAALRQAPRDEARIKRAAEKQRKFLADKAAGKLPPYEVVGGRR